MIMRKNCCAVFSAKASTVKQPPNYGPEDKNMFKNILLLIISLISSIKGYGFQNKNPMANNKFWKSMYKNQQKSFSFPLVNIKPCLDCIKFFTERRQYGGGGANIVAHSSSTAIQPRLPNGVQALFNLQQNIPVLFLLFLSSSFLSRTR